MAMLQPVPSPDSPPALAPPGGARNLGLFRVIIGGSGPLAVGLVVALGMLVIHSFNLPNYGREMWAAAIISVVAGLLAVLPILVMLGRGIVMMMRLTMVAVALRMVLTLIGVILASGPGWKLAIVPLVAWVGGCYLALLVAESAAMAWVARRGQSG